MRFGAHRAALLFYYCLFCPTPLWAKSYNRAHRLALCRSFPTDTSASRPTPSTNTLMPHTLIVSGHTDLNNSAANLRILDRLERDLANVEVLRLDALYTHTLR